MVALSYYLNRKYFPTPYDVRRIVENVVVALALYAVGECSMHYLSDVAWLMWSVNVVVFVLFGGYAVRREGIDVGGLVAHAKSKFVKR